MKIVLTDINKPARVAKDLGITETKAAEIRRHLPNEVRDGRRPAAS